MTDTRKNIFFDATPLVNKHLSGIGKVLLETLKSMDTANVASKYDIYIFVPFNERKKLDSFNFIHIKVKCLPYHHKVLSLFSRMKYSPPIDIFLGRGYYVFENYRNWNLFYSGSKSITYIHDIAFKLHPSYVEGVNLRYLNNNIDIWIARADRIVTVSNSSKQEIEQQLDIDNVDVVPNASDDDMYPRDKSEIRKVTEKWDIPGKYFVYLGNIEPRKNLVNMIRGFSEYIKDTNSDSSLVIIGGDGWNNDEIHREIKGARGEGVSIIKPSKYVPDEDIPAILSGASALIQLSWHEGFGMSVLHAIACGTPVLASDIGSLHDAAAGNDRRVMYVNPSSTRDITMAMKTIAKKEHFDRPDNIPSWNESANKLLTIIESL